MSGRVEVAEMVPEPTELEYGYDTPTCRDRCETYFRYGYQIDGGTPFMVEEYVRNEIQASKLAQAKADYVKGQLHKLGARSKVIAWVQEWTSQTVISYSVAKVVIL